MVEVSPVRTLAGAAEHEITGGWGSFTVNLALQDAKPFFLLPSFKLAVTPYEPGCKPVVSIVVEASLPATFTPVPSHSYLTVRLGLKLDPLAVAVTGSPAKTSAGCAEQAALGGTGGGLPPKRNTSPVESRTLFRCPLGPVGEEGSLNCVLK